MSGCILGGEDGGRINGGADTGVGGWHDSRRFKAIKLVMSDTTSATVEPRSHAPLHDLEVLRSDL